MLERTPVAAAAAVVAALCATPSFSQAVATLPTVTVEAERDAQRARQQASVATIVVDEVTVERYGDATVGDVLRRLPGMTFTGPAGVVKDIRMRGLDKGYTQYLINGEPVPSATKERQFQVDRLPADMIERIEIVRNPSAAMDADGVGGAINIVLKQTADNLTRLRVAGGRNGNLSVGDVVAQIGRKFGDWDMVLALSHTQGAEDIVENKEKLNAAGVVTERETKGRPARKGETLLSPRLTWRNGADRLTLDAYASEGTEDKEEFSAIRNNAGVYTKGTTKIENKDDAVWRLGARYDGVTTWGSWFAKAGVQQAHIDKGATTTENNAAGVVTKRALEQEVVADQGSYAGAGTQVPLGEHHRLSGGVEWRSNEFDTRKAKSENGVDKTSVGDRYNVQENRLIAFVEDKWRLAQGHWLTPGLRVETVERDAVDGNGLMRAGSHRFANPSLHYRWEAAKDTNLRASWARTSRLPRFDQINPLRTTNAGSVGNPDTIGNPDLQPERANGIELGVERFFAGRRGVVSANLYHRDVKDFIEKVTSLESGRYVQRPINVSSAAFYGLEIDWRVPLRHKGAHSLSLTGNHTEMRGHVFNNVGVKTGVKDMPPRITNVGLDWTHRPSRWSAGFNVTLQPTFTNRSVNDNGRIEQKTREASTLLDVYVGKTFGPLAELRLVVKNILSDKKDEKTTVYTASGAVESAENKVERSRPTVYLTYEARF